MSRDGLSRTTFTREALSILRMYKTIMDYRNNSEALEHCVADSMRWRLMAYCVSTGRSPAECYEAASSMDYTDAILVLSRVTAFEAILASRGVSRAR